MEIIKILIISLPLICLLFYPHAASTTTLSPPSSALLAAKTLRTRGYSLVSKALLTLPSNFSGTILAPPDFAFSSRSPPQLTADLLHYHTLKPPRILTSSALSSLNHGDELLTLYHYNCLFLSKNSDTGSEEISISSTPHWNPTSFVIIRQPDLYVDGSLIVHGVDSVLDLNSATECAFSDTESTASRKINRSYLDEAMRALRRTGYSVVATALGLRKFDLLSLDSVSIFAVSDSYFFRKSDGLRYDFSHHVLPIRRRVTDLQGLTESTEFKTLAGNQSVAINSVDGAVEVDGVTVGGKDVYHNRWIVVMSVTTSLDAVISAELNRSGSGLGYPFAGGVAESETRGTVSSVVSVVVEVGEEFSAVNRGRELYDVGVEDSQSSDGGDREL